MDQMKNFVASDVPLEGSNLIEASAGTGKTYSIAILLLRLLLEKQLALKEVLMVTFTKAAVAELEERIRLFVRIAAKAANDIPIKDTTILQLVNKAIEKQGESNVKELLTQAVLLLDDTSVMTIHSFCQQTLNEFAFETGQLFGCETLKDSGPLLEDEINKFWRAHVTSIPLKLLIILIDNGLSRANFSEVLNGHYGGKRYIAYVPDAHYALSSDLLENEWIDIEKILSEADGCVQTLHTRIINDEGNLRAATAANRYAHTALSHLLDSPEEFIKQIKAKRNSGYINTLYGHLLVACDEIDEIMGRISERADNIISTLYCMSIREASINIQAYKNRNSVLSFDDMIINLHTATVKDYNEQLLQSLRAKYKAVFVDEFQDTDKLQYEIFEQVFGQTNILFYIGDPKQSIYAWRKADINTYLKAATTVANNYSMNINYRSCPAYIHSMNVFFQPVDGFDTFAFGGQENSFGYIPVDAPSTKTVQPLLKDRSPETPILLFECPTNDSIAAAVAKQVLALLEDKSYQLEVDGEYRSVKPSDIGILVRKNKQGKLIKNALAAVRIPAVTIDDSKILKSNEATALLYLLQAFEDKNRGSINKALLSPFTGFDRDQILLLNDDQQQERFKIYSVLWDQQGIYVSFAAFLRDYKVRSVLLNHSHGERVLTNLMQLVEILHKTQTANKLNNGELIAWLQKATEGMDVQGDEFEQRIESDEEAVKIITIHKSKGLEYNIVFAPFLDMLPEGVGDFCSFRDTDSGEYLFAHQNQLSDEQSALLSEQLEQENRRMIYVAVTRAVYKCYIYKNTASYYNNSSLKTFIAGLKTLEAENELIQFADHTAIPSHSKYSGKLEWKPLKHIEPAQFQLSDQNWHKLSYTFLSRKQPFIIKENNNNAVGEYESFIFKQLPKSIVTGHLLHYILENIDFTKSTNWEKVIDMGIRRFMPATGDTYSKMLFVMLEHIVNAEINIDGTTFALTDVGRNKRISEFEFDFNVGSFVNTAIEELSNNEAKFLVGYEEQLEGMMNGKIDLIFEYAGKYYILDWKSNFLGDSLSWYNTNSLRNTMNDGNYHLQYLIYTLALKKYLTVKLQGFDYESQFGGVAYMFLRGLRKNQESGIFSCVPPLEQIEKLENILIGAETVA
jgi:exodeoxyribonuclease V beta subunit